MKNIYNLIQLARKHHVEGNLVQAEHVYRKIIKIQPNNAGAVYELGNVLRDKGQLMEAILNYKKAINIDTKFSGSYNNWGNVLRQSGQLEEAIYYFRKAVVLSPNFAGAYYNLAQTLDENGQIEEAITLYEKTLQLDPNLVNAYYNLGNVLRDVERQEGAIACYQKVLQINPNHYMAYNNLGNTLRDLRRDGEALACYHKALEVNPNHADTYANLGNTLAEMGHVAEAEISYRRALQVQPNLFAAYSNLLLIMNYTSHNAANIFTEHCRFDRQVKETLRPILPLVSKRSNIQKLRIGYVSPDFRKHSVSYFIEPVLMHHDRAHFEVYCYSNSKQHDEVTGRIQGYIDQWRNIKGMSDEQAAELIHKDKIDILIDLAGHTADNRILLFAYKPAPMQVTWIGYPCTTGLSTIDYKIADNYTDPPGMMEQFYSEKLIRLPESFLCYNPNRDSPDIGKLPALTSRQITFGSFNNFRKVTHEVVSLWAKILESIPNSNLIMKARFSDSACDYAREMFQKEGIVSERIELLQWESSTRAHLGKYNLVDIGLDTFPYNGTTTTCEAMWMGVPVVTLCGNTPASRVGISLLSNVGFPELVAKTTHEYISIAVNLANDLKRLQSLREHLRNMMLGSPLCDAKRFTASLEMCYRQIWEKGCESVE